nr:DUF2075 domain-containing protein [Schleiferilactobacillus shenzhenensis]
MADIDLSAATFLLGPEQTFSPDQEKLAQAVMSFVRQHLPLADHAVFVITGDAGTGKSAVLAHLFASLQTQARSGSGALAGTQNTLLVNHQEMLKIYQEVAGANPVLRKKDFMKPTPFINAAHRSGSLTDVTFVDEGHLLLTEPDRYNRFDQTNQLAEIIRASRVTVLVFDPHQVLKLKSYWDWPRLRTVLAPYPHTLFDLDTQFRVHSQAAVQSWINAFTAGTIAPWPVHPGYDLRVFADGTPLYQRIEQQDARYGLARVLATADFPFTVFGPTKWYVTAGTLRLPWDKISMTATPWAQRPETLHEVGSIYTIQGFDLNYAGIILGPSVGYDPATRQVTVDVTRYQDNEAFKKRSDLPDLTAARAQIMRNAINVLCKRGRHGLYLYAVDPQLRAALLAAQAKGEDNGH